MKCRFQSAFCLLSLTLSIFVAPSVIAKKVTLNWWIDHGPSELPLFKQVVKQFEAKNPGIEVKISNSNGTGYYDKLMAAGAAGTMPDVYYSRGGSGDARFYARGLALDITPFVKRDWKEINGSDFLDAQIAELMFKNRWMALPYDYSTQSVYYNKNILSQAGVPFFGDTVTWNEVIAGGMKVTKTDANGRRTIAGFETLPFSQPQWLEGMMLSDGARFLNDKGTKCLLDSPESIRFFQSIADLGFKRTVAARLTDPAYTGYSSKKAAMCIDGSWATITKRKLSQFSWDVTSLPCNDPRRQVTSATGGSWSISRATKHKDEAWKLMKFIASPEVMRQLIVTPIRSMPSRKSLLPEWSANIKREGLDPRNADAFWLGAKKNGKNSPILPFDYRSIINSAYDQVRQNKKGIDQILKAATQAMNIELDKAAKRGLL